MSENVLKIYMFFCVDRLNESNQNAHFQCVVRYKQYTYSCIVYHEGAWGMRHKKNIQYENIPIPEMT